MLVQPVDRAGGVAQHAVDAHAELFVLFELGGSLQVFSGRRLVILADYPWLYDGELFHEVGEVHHEVSYHREVAQRLNAYRSRSIVAQERRAGQLRLAVDRHTAAS